MLGLALDSHFLSPGFGASLSIPVYYFLAFIAGFSETFVPNTLRRAEQGADDRGDGRV